MKTAARIIRKHYGLMRPVAQTEVAAELANLQRKQKSGLLDDSQLALYSALRPFMGALDQSVN